MKALIVTINDRINYNFGNKLQNYAICKVLKKFGIDSYTLSFERKQRRLKNKIMSIIGPYAAKSKKRKDYWKYQPKKIDNFNRFEKGRLIYHEDFTLKNSSDFDYYIVGSDQVWNPEFFKYHELKKEAYLLTFCENSKKVCFSPSFGISQLPEEWKPWFREHLSKIQYISVREDAGASIVKELTGKDAEVLIDPTLMLTAADWKKCAVKPAKTDVSQKYILLYFLGEMSEKNKSRISEIASSRNLKIMNMFDKEQIGLYTAGPSEFLYMIMNAELVITDSFHACVFSFLFNRPFAVYNRKSEYSDMSSRIDTLLSKFHLTDRRMENIIKNDDIFNADYKEGYEILENERKKVIDFLKKSLDIN